MKNTFKRCACVLMLTLLVAGLFIVTLPAMAEPEVTNPVAPTSVTLSTSGTIKMAINSELTLVPTLSPSDATTTFTWRSSKTKVATVSNGTVKAKKVGTAKITVTTANLKKATVTVKVYDPYLPSSVKLDHSGTVKVPLGDTLTLTPTLYPSTAESTFTWKSSSKKIATVSGGVVKAKKVGTATITVTTRNKKKAKVKVKVYDPYLPSAVYLDKSGTQTLLVSNALQLTATLAPESAKSGLKWKSSNKRVAIVNSDGLVGGLSPGTTTITVTTRNKKKAKIKIKVIDDGKQPIVPPSGYDLPYVIYACKNSHTVAIIAKDENGDWTRVIRKFPTGMGRKNVTDVGFFYLAKKERWHKWGSGYSPYANKLSVGIYLHGPIYKAKNHYTIRPSYYNCIGTDCSSGCIRTVCGCAAWVYYNCPVGTMVIVGQNSRYSEPRPTKLKKNATTDPTDPGNNPEILITKFTVEPAELSLDLNATQALTPANITPYNTSTRGFKYASSDMAVATVSETGVVTAVGAGTAVITVTAADDFACKVQVPVTVNGGISYGAELVDPVDPDDDVANGDIVPQEDPTADEAAANEEKEPGADDPSDKDEADVEIIPGTEDDAVDTPEADGALPPEDNGLSASAEEVAAERNEMIIND